MRRIMRPSADDAGQPASGGEAVAPDAAPPIGEPNPGANPFARPAAEPPTGVEAPAGEIARAEDAQAEAAPEEQPAAAEQPTQMLPAAEAAPAEGEQPAAAAPAEGEQPAAAEGEQTASIPAVPAPPRRRLFRRRPKPVLPVEGAEPAPVAEAAVVLPAPDGPAGLDPAEAALRPPAGRRGRLRRRLRYLRRARELMLRDLGGLVFEIHRTGGGDMASHAPLVAGKVDRLRQVDAESVALESALDAPRGEAVVFQPGVGGTCVVCGELYASTAKFCSECGTSTAAVVVTEEPAPASPVVGSPAVEPGGSLGFAKAGPATFTSGDPLAQRPPAEEPTVAEPAEPAAAEPAAAEPAAEEPTVAEPADPQPAAAEREPPPAAPARTEPERNGVVPPTLSPGDPLATRKPA